MTDTEKQGFVVDQAAHYQMGSDAYSVTIKEVQGNRITAIDKRGDLLVFTRRGNGVFKLRGMKGTGTLRHGSYDYLDPSF